MAIIRVVNKYHLARPEKPPDGVVRRAIHRGTPLGNPFVMKDSSQKERDRVCESYSKWLGPKLLQESPQLTYFMELAALVRDPECHYLDLICFCAPKRCHGDTVKEYLEKHLAEVGGEV